MTFVKDKTGSAQTAANASAVLVAAFSGSFEDFDAAAEAYNELRVQLQEELFAIVDGDNAAFAAEDKGSSNGSSKSTNRSSKSTSSRGSKTSGSKSRGSKSTISLDDALGMELTWGAFDGETLGDVLKLSIDACQDDYDYGDGERDGRDYISWLASDKNQNEFIQRRARVIADDEGIDY